MLWLAGLFLGASALAFSQAGASREEAHTADVYTIYSRLLTNPRTSHGPDNNEIYLIGGTTVPGTPAEPCVHVPPDRAARWSEVLADYNARRANPAAIEPRFRITKPYRVLRTSDLAEFAAVTKTLTQQVSDFFRLSDVYFDTKRTLALTAISTYCGGLCGQWGWRVFEKSPEGDWQEREWVSCFTVAHVLITPRSNGLPERGVPRVC